MAESLSGGNVAIALLANTLATVGGLYILIEIFSPVSGAHFNPAVSGVMPVRGELPRRELLPYIPAQLLGAMLGAWLAHAMFDMTILQFSHKVRSGVMVGFMLDHPIKIDRPFVLTPLGRRSQATQAARRIGRSRASTIPASDREVRAL